MSYASNLDEQVRHGAMYVDRVLNGEKPGDLPVQQTTKFDLAINLKTAKAIGLQMRLRCCGAPTRLFNDVACPLRVQPVTGILRLISNVSLSAGRFFSCGKGAARCISASDVASVWIDQMNATTSRARHCFVGGGVQALPDHALAYGDESTGHT
jgi:ABC transporter substrate binding protein